MLFPELKPKLQLRKVKSSHNRYSLILYQKQNQKTSKTSKVRLTLIAYRFLQKKLPLAPSYQRLKFLMKRLSIRIKLRTILTKQKTCVQNLQVKLKTAVIRKGFLKKMIPALHAHSTLTNRTNPKWLRDFNKNSININRKSMPWNKFYKDLQGNYRISPRLPNKYPRRQFYFRLTTLQ